MPSFSQLYSFFWSSKSVPSPAQSAQSHPSSSQSVQSPPVPAAQSPTVPSPSQFFLPLPALGSGSNPLSSPVPAVVSPINPAICPATSATVCPALSAAVSSAISPVPALLSPVGPAHASVSPSAAAIQPSVPVPSSSSIPIGSLFINLSAFSGSGPSHVPSPSLNKHPMFTRSKASHFSLFTSSMASPDLSLVEPTSHTEALQTLEWTQAMNEEFQALHNQKTWTLVLLPLHKHAIGC
ncbi:mucin-1-like [Camellia sinensis]|uniref:mucin-1-like n=1 Tax=Camellia sinensis TaxID=4442 RepID=UPI0010357C13|nr:mucin-1-like [Camellia sinensis]